MYVRNQLGWSLCFCTKDGRKIVIDRPDPDKGTNLRNGMMKIEGEDEKALLADGIFNEYVKNGSILKSDTAFAGRLTPEEIAQAYKNELDTLKAKRKGESGEKEALEKHAKMLEAEITRLRAELKGVANGKENGKESSTEKKTGRRKVRDN